MRIEELADKYERATEEFLAAVAKVSASDLDKAPEGEWSARQIIHHQAHADAYCLTRIIQVLSEPGTAVRSFSESALVESDVLAYSTIPIEPSVALFKAVRSEALRIIRSASDSDLSKSCVHSTFGEFSFEAMVIRFTEHPVGHAHQLSEASGG